jgi:hypothetical protein
MTTEAESIMFAMLALKRCKSQMALFWREGRIRAAQAEGGNYRLMMLSSMPDLVGVYSAGCPAQLIADDIATLYQ